MSDNILKTAQDADADFDNLISGLVDEAGGDEVQSGDENKPSTTSTSTFQPPIHGSYKIIGTFLPNQYVNATHSSGHWGLDLQAPSGTPVYATAPGKVINTSPNPKGGNAVKIQHPGNITSYVAHLQTISCNVGDEVNQNTVIGTVGNTGNAQHTSPHVHFEIKIGGSNVDPASMFGKEVKQAEMEQLLNKISHLAKAAKILNAYGVNGVEILKEANYNFKKAAQLAKSKC